MSEILRPKEHDTQFRTTFLMSQKLAKRGARFRLGRSMPYELLAGCGRLGFELEQALFGVGPARRGESAELAVGRDHAVAGDDDGDEVGSHDTADGA